MSKDNQETWMWLIVAAAIIWYVVGGFSQPNQPSMADMRCPEGTHAETYVRGGGSEGDYCVND